MKTPKTEKVEATTLDELFAKIKASQSVQDALKGKKEEEEEEEETCPGCDAAATDDFDEALAGDIAAFANEGDDDLLVNKLAFALMYVAKRADMQCVSRAAHDIWFER